MLLLLKGPGCQNVKPLCRSSGAPTCSADNKASLTWQFWNGEQWVASNATVSCSKHSHGATQAEQFLSSDTVQLLQLVKDLKTQPKVAVVPRRQKFSKRRFKVPANDSKNKNSLDLGGLVSIS